jgi:circadian clock protein KaiC
MLMERCQTGIPGFDGLCDGGLTRNSVNALLGGPGAGKTIFMVQFLVNGATKFNENGLYVSFEVDFDDLFKDAIAFGWDLQKLDGEDKVKFLKISPETDATELKKELTKLVSKHKIRRVCIDPITLFALAENNLGKVREMVFDVTAMLKKMDVTVILASETASADTEEMGVGGSADAKSQYVKFLSDAIIDLYSSGLGGVSDRAVRISKMRRTAHFRGPAPMEISKAGIKIVSSDLMPSSKRR